MQYRITKTKNEGRFLIDLPGSKSISNRLLILSALTNGKIKLNNISHSDDSRIMHKLLSSKEFTKNAGHAGTVMRFLTAYYSNKPGKILLTGSERMKNRPIAELVDALRYLGAQIQYTNNQGFPPLKIKGRSLKGGKITINSEISSQYISALMLIGPFLEEGLEIELSGDTISLSYIDLTLGILRQIGADALRRKNRIIIKPSVFKDMRVDVEPDWSSASYWYSICGLSDNIEIVLPGLKEDSLQGDAHIKTIFLQLGVTSSFKNEGLVLTSAKQTIEYFEYDFRNNPDMVQSFIPYCIAKSIPFSFSGCRTLRIKETDRIQALSNEFRKFGVVLNYSEDGNHISWDGKSIPNWNQKIVIETYDDHRMALGFAPLAIKTKELIIKKPEVVSKSYPGFWENLRKLGFEIDIL